MITTARLWSAALIVSLSLVAGCAAPVKEQAQAGFLSDYSKLEDADDNATRYISPKLANYSTFMIDDVEILYTEDSEDPVFTDEQVEDIKTRIIGSVTAALSKDGAYKMAYAPAPGVGRIRVGITKLDETTGALNVLIWTKVTGAGLGGLAIEAEMVDSMSGEQIVAATRWGTGSRVLRAGFTDTGDAMILAEKWAKEFRKRLDKAHGVSK